MFITGIRKKIRYGIPFCFEALEMRLGVRKYYSQKAVLAKQHYFETMEKSCYQKELEDWYKESTGHDLDIKDPKRFTEKIQWLKLYDSTELKGILTDKYLVREWIEQKIGNEYLIPLIGVYDKFSDIDIVTLPKSFIMKCNHGSHMNIKVEDKDNIEWREVEKITADWLKLNYAFCTGSFELHYNYIKPKIIIEELLVDEANEDLMDYKFYCFNGIPTFCQVISNRAKNEAIDFFDMNWEHQKFVGLNPTCKNSEIEIPKPIHFEKIKELAQVLSEGFPFVRVDFYEIDGVIYFGEMTFTPNSGGGRFLPDEQDYILGDMLKLDELKNNKLEQ